VSLVWGTNIESESPLLAQRAREKWGTQHAPGDVLESKLVSLGGDDSGDNAVQASWAGGDGSDSRQPVS